MPIDPADVRELERRERERDMEAAKKERMAIEEKIEDLSVEDSIREVLAMLLERIKELEERVAAPPVRLGKRP